MCMIGPRSLLRPWISSVWVLSVEARFSYIYKKKHTSSFRSLLIAIVWGSDNKSTTVNMNYCTGIYISLTVYSKLNHIQTLMQDNPITIRLFQMNYRNCCIKVQILSLNFSIITRKIPFSLHWIVFLKHTIHNAVQRLIIPLER